MLEFQFQKDSKAEVATLSCSWTYSEVLPQNEMAEVSTSPRRRLFKLFLNAGLLLALVPLRSIRVAVRTASCEECRGTIGPIETVLKVLAADELLELGAASLYGSRGTIGPTAKIVET